MPQQADRRTASGGARGRLRAWTARSSFVLDLRSVLAERNFRRLFATRLVSQAGDGVFNAGFGTYVFFSAQSFPDPVAGAEAFAVLYLPYSLIGPFAGVLIDRWSRRQILVFSALIRAAFVTITALLVATGSLGLPLYVCVLAVLGVNRFFLSSLSAALPHVVEEDTLVMANSVSTTLGGIAASSGGLAGLVAHLITGGGRAASAVILLTGAACYLLAGLIGATMRRDLLGPVRVRRESRAGLVTELAIVARGLVDGARYISRQRRAATALAATGCQRLLYGILFLMAILLYRNYFYHSVSANQALGHFTLLVTTSAIGYAAAALITPPVTRRISKTAWIACLLALGGILTGPLGATFRPVSFLIVGFGINLVAQGVAICATTIIQEDVDDDYRGRVFSLNDMLFGATFSLGATAAAQFMPATGKSYLLITVVAAGYLVAAAGYWALSRQPPGGASGPAGPAGPSSPSAVAQRSSS